MSFRFSVFAIGVILLSCLLPSALSMLGVDSAGYHNHMLLKWSTVSVAVLTMIMAFIHYSKCQDVMVPIIGVALLLSTAPAITTQIHLAFGTTELFNNHFNIAHTLKNITYLTVFLGILLDYIKATPSEEVVEHTRSPLSYKFPFTIFASHRLTSPLRQMTESVQDYERTGNIENLPTNAKDEIGVLARAFHNVLGRIEEREESLRTLNKTLVERTADAKASAARMQAILETAADAIITIDTRGNIQSFNYAAVAIFGYEEKEVLNKNVKMLMPSPYQNEHDGYLKSYQKTGRKRMIGGAREEEALRKNGEVFPIDLSISEVKTDGERVFTGLIRDISERRAAESTLIEITQDLVAQSLELQSSRKKSDAANQAKSEFLANMSHEIRTPMNGIIGTSSLMAETNLSKKQQDYLGTIRNSSESLLQLINDILDFSKIEAGKLEFEILPFDLRVLMEEVKSVMHAHMKDGVELQIDLDDTIPRYVKGDPGRIRQVLLNLVGNAIKFTEKGHIIINIQSAGEEDNQHKYLVSVEDTGIGIPKDKLEHIFYKFGQAEESTTRRFGGTGLGLSICSKLVHMMDGEISVESVEKEGSKFWFTMLLPLSSVQEIEITMSHKRIEDIEDLQFDKVHILIAEDNRTNMMIATQILEQYGCNVTPAGNGIEAVERASKQIFDLIFMDCRMPEMDGYDATIAIREHEKKQKLSAVPIIALTANAMIGDRDKCIAVGMDDYVAKPVKSESLVAILLKWLPDKKRERAA